MNSHWTDVGCASISVVDLPALSDLRRRPEIRVSIVGDRAWVYWQPGSEAARDALVRHIMPLPGVELFIERAGGWYRLGDHLPAFRVPPARGPNELSLQRAVLPKPVAPRRPEDRPPEPVPVRLVHDRRGQSRPANALRCRLATLATWADHATSAQLASVQGAWVEGPGGAAEEAEVLVLGVPGRLPMLPLGLRFWGIDLLIPVGFRTEPDLPEPSLRHAVGAGPEDLVVLDQDGFELISRRVFQPLSRAGIQLAREGMRSGRPWGDRRS
jgi:hypothetical protein